MVAPTSYVTDTIHDFPFALIGRLMERNELSRIRRCLVCRRFMIHGLGRKPDFCSDRCSAFYFNQKVHGEKRVRSRVVKLSKLAKKRDMGLSDKDKAWIVANLGMNDFLSVTAELQKLINKTATDRFIKELPQALHDRLAEPRAYEKKSTEKGRSRGKSTTKKRRKNEKIEKYLYEHQHVTKDRQVTTRFYAKFTSWERRPLTIPLGDNINAAR